MADEIQLTPISTKEDYLTALPVTEGQLIFVEDSKRLFYDLEGERHEVSGDMFSSVYDPQGKSQDAFKYTDDAVDGLPVKRLVNNTESPVDLDALVEPGVYFFDKPVAVSVGSSSSAVSQISVSVLGGRYFQSMSLFAASGIESVVRYSDNGVWGGWKTSAIPAIDATGKFPATFIPDLSGDYLSASGGTLTGPIAMNGNRVTGLGEPTVDTDVATKKYADTKVSIIQSETQPEGQKAGDIWYHVLGQDAGGDGA